MKRLAALLRRLKDARPALILFSHDDVLVLRDF